MNDAEVKFRDELKVDGKCRIFSIGSSCTCLKFQFENIITARIEQLSTTREQLANIVQALDYNVERLGQTTSAYFGLSTRIVDLIDERNDLREQLVQVIKERDEWERSARGMCD